MNAADNQPPPPPRQVGNDDLIQRSERSEENLKAAWETLKTTWCELKDSIRELFQEERNNVNGENQEEIDKLKKRITELIDVGDNLTREMTTMNDTDMPRFLATLPVQRGGYRYKTPKNRRKTKTKSKTKSKSPSKSKKSKKSRRKSKY